MKLADTRLSLRANFGRCLAFHSRREEEEETGLLDIAPFYCESFRTESPGYCALFPFRPWHFQEPRYQLSATFRLHRNLKKSLSRSWGAKQRKKRRDTLLLKVTGARCAFIFFFNSFQFALCPRSFFNFIQRIIRWKRITMNRRYSRLCN